MRHLSIQSVDLKQTPSGEKIAVLVGRHEQHGASEHHTVAIVHLAPGQTSEGHFHRKSEESYIVLKGRGEAIINGQKTLICAGDLVYTVPGETHQFCNTGSETLEYLVVTAPRWTPQDSFKS